MGRDGRGGGFTLIELLVVISIIGLLLMILLPMLSRARETAREAACLGNLQQLGVAVYAHAADASGRIPSGPDITYPLLPTTTWAQNMSNWVWVMPPLLPRPMHNAHGVLLDGYLSDPRAIMCPGSDTPDYYQGELERYRDLNVDVYSSYMYRQLDQTTEPYVEDLGYNAAGERARGLFVDVNSLSEPPTTNHGGKVANVAYLDGHAKRVDNSAGWLTAREEDYSSLPGSFDSLLDRIAIMVLAMDYSEHGDLNDWSP